MSVFQGSVHYGGYSILLLHLPSHDARRGLGDLELGVAHLRRGLAGEEDDRADGFAVGDDRADDLRGIALRVLLAGHGHKARAVCAVGGDDLPGLDRLL